MTTAATAEQVLANSIAQGAQSGDYFGYADGRDEEGRFLGLKLGERPMVDMRSGLVVVREKSLEQLAVDRAAEKSIGPDGDIANEGDGGHGGTHDNEGDANGPSGLRPQPETSQVHEVELEAVLDQWSAGSDVGTIVEEILQRLYDLKGASARLTLTVEVSVPGGINETTMRIITENARNLGVTLRTE